MTHTIKVAQASRRANQQARREAEKRFLCFRRHPLFPEEGIRVMYSTRFTFGHGVVAAFVTLHTDGPMNRIRRLSDLLEMSPSIHGRRLEATGKIRRAHFAWRFTSVRPGGDELLRRATEIARKIMIGTDFPVYVMPFNGRTFQLLEEVQAGNA